jgi:hypothetical protein
MMRIRPIPTSVTLLMAAIVFAAPLIANLFIDRPHPSRAENSGRACVTDCVDTSRLQRDPLTGG